jgi:endonuclease/exonuclease/phosphatase family metal-dependent hydrolase
VHLTLFYALIAKLFQLISALELGIKHTTFANHPVISRFHREEQVRAVLDWMDAGEAIELCREVVFVGDFNAPPNEPAYALLANRSFHSAHQTIHGMEPKFTFPTGLCCSPRSIFELNF